MMITMGFATPFATPPFGAMPALAAIEASAGKTTAETETPDTAFARLANLIRSNDRHLAEMKALNARLAEAKAYLARPDANVALGRARLDRVRWSRSRVLAILRANRLAAQEFLAI